MYRPSLEIILFGLVAALAATVVNGQWSRIIGGEVMTIEQVPHTVLLRDMDESLMCGGTLVSPEHVVTAAHCFESHDPLKDVIVVAGVTTFFERGVQRRIVKFFKPSTYTRETMHTDLVVLKLSSPLPLSEKIKPVGLCEQPLKPNDKIQVSGWGRMKEKGRISQKVQSITIPIIPHEDCVRKYSEHRPDISDTMVCAYFPKQDACQFDSGGPGIFKNQLCAVVSFGLGCAYEDYPGVYTNVYAMRKFIEDAMKE